VNGDDLNTSNIRRLENTLQLQLQWIEAAESRITIILPLSVAMLGSLAFLFSGSNITISAIAFGFIAALMLTLSVIFAGSAFFPRTDSPNDSGIYFGTIAKKKLPEYRSSAVNTSLDDYTEDLIHQIHVNASIASIKYKRFRHSIFSLAIAFVPWCVALYENSVLVHGH
jgi:hypothetical protein